MENLSKEKLSSKLKELKKKYPKAINITFGTNNITNGYWFDNGEYPKHRTFFPI